MVAELGGRRSIGAEACAANDDSLRCWRFPADFAPAGGGEVRWQFGHDRQDARPREPADLAGDRRGVPTQACPGECPGGDGTGLHEEGPQRMLEGGDGTVGVGEGGLEMGEDVAPPAGAGTAGSSGGGQRADSAVRILLWPWSKRFQMRCQVRSLRWQSTARMAATDAAGDGALEEPPQSSRWSG